MKKIIKIGFYEFLSEGELCGIDIGTSRETVLHTLGKPVTWSESMSTNFEDATWWIYGKLQIRFTNNKIDVFGFYFTMDHKEAENILIQNLPAKNMNMNEFIGNYNIEGMKKNKVNNKDEIIFPSGLIANFGFKDKLVSVRKDFGRI